MLAVTTATLPADAAAWFPLGWEAGRLRHPAYRGVAKRGSSCRTASRAARPTMAVKVG
jgi:hypothetical protein